MNNVVKKVSKLWKKQVPINKESSYSCLDLKRSKIQELLEYIEERLTELEQEKQDLKEFQEADRDRRCLEYAIYSQEQNDAVESLELLNESHRVELEESRQKFSESVNRGQTIQDLEQELRSARHKLDIICLERSQVEEDLQHHVKKRTQLELNMNDLNESSAKNKDLEVLLSF